MPFELDQQSIITQIDDVLSQMQSLRRPGTGSYSPDPEGWQICNHNIAIASAAIERLTPNNSTYRKSLKRLLSNCNLTDYSTIKSASEALKGQLQALKADYQRGYTQSFMELIHADLFSDFMGMAQHLLDEGHYIPAAVLIGGVLEENLRKLCEKAEIPLTHTNRDGEEIPRKAAHLNDELKKNDIYNGTVHKQVTAWQAIRNNAAHGPYDELSLAEVKLMYQGVLNFLNQQAG